MWAGARADVEFKAAKDATSAKARFDPEMRSLGKTDLLNFESPKQVGRFNRLEGENALTLIWTNHLGGSTHASFRRIDTA